MSEKTPVKISALLKKISLLSIKKLAVTKIYCGQQYFAKFPMLLDL